MSKRSIGPASQSIKDSAGARSYPFDFYSTTYSTVHGNEDFQPRQARHSGTGYRSNFRPSIYYSPQLDRKDNPALGRELLNVHASVTKRDYLPSKDKNGTDPFPAQVHDITSGYSKNLPQTIPRSKECDLFGHSEYKTDFVRKQFRSGSTEPSEASRKEETGFSRVKEYNVISLRPLEAFADGSHTQYMYPTERSVMKGDFHQFKGNSGKEPLQSVSKKANHSNGFTKGNKAVAEFAASPQGFTSLEQMHPKTMNSIKRSDPAEAMNIINPHNRFSMKQLTYKPPTSFHVREETRALQLGAVSTGKKELTGYCENELANLEHIRKDDNPTKFSTLYNYRFCDPNPAGLARMGHTNGGVFPPLPNGFTKSTQAATFGPLTT